VDPFVSNEENKVLWKRPQWLYLQSLFFFITCKWAQSARVLHYTRLEKLARDKHSSLVDPFVSNEENKVLWKRPQDLFGGGIQATKIGRVKLGALTSHRRTQCRKPFILFDLLTSGAIYDWPKRFAPSDICSKLRIEFCVCKCTLQSFILTVLIEWNGHHFRRSVTRHQI
jgi:hypothetical protein